MIPVIPDRLVRRIETDKQRFKHLDEGAEALAFRDKQTNVVYKILHASPNMGRIGDGYVTGEIYESGLPASPP